MLTLRSILVPVDFSSGSALALRYALALRRGERGFGRGARLTVVHAVNGELALAGASILELSRRRLRRFVEGTLAGDEAPDLEQDAVEGDPRAVIPTLAESHDLVVIGATGERAAHPLTPGGIAEAVVRRSPAPVLTVKGLDPERLAGGVFQPGEAVLATDFTDFSAGALRHAMAFAFAYGARLTALHVVRGARELPAFERMPFPLREQVDRFYEEELGWQRDELGRFLRDRLGADRPVEIREAVRAGRPAEEIAAECLERGADLLVLATHGHGGLKRALIGSVAERALRLAPCPVLTVRPPPAAERAGGAS